MTTPAGWYPDPSGSGGQRYFDGVQWTNHQLAAPSPKRWRWPWMVCAVVVLLLAVCGTVFVVGEHMGAWSVLTGQGAIAKDGDLQFALKDFYQGESRDAPQSLGKAFIATIAVTNSGGGPQSFAARDQKLIDAADREYPAVGMVERSSPKHETTMLNVDPGVTLNVLIRFEGLASAKPAAVELHQSTSSTGARISLH